MASARHHHVGACADEALPTPAKPRPAPYSGPGSSPQVLTTGSWPTTTQAKCNLPRELEVGMAHGAVGLSGARGAAARLASCSMRPIGDLLHLTSLSGVGGPVALHALAQHLRTMEHVASNTWFP